VTRIVFSGDGDLLAVRFARSPAWETHLAVRTLLDERSRLYHEPWHGAVRAAAARLDLDPLFATHPLSGFVPDFLAPPPSHPTPTLGEQLGQIRATSLRQVRKELERCFASSAGGGVYGTVLTSLIADPAAARELLAVRMEEAWDALVAPFWPRIEALIEADIGYRSHRLVTLGLRGVLDGLHPGIRWADGAVEVDDGSDTEVALAGRGLVLMPSAYAWPTVSAIIDPPWQPTLVYPARGVAELWAASAPPPRSLARLLGQTRALLLVSLERPTSTTSLAERLGRSTSGVSGHLLALRDAGLVATSRHGHEVRYARTRLGVALARASESRPLARAEALSSGRSGSEKAGDA
jgi:DNA-binding transcriptional ArsR family regulator